MQNEDTLKSKAYKYIKEKILLCEYEPGAFLDEKMLIENINSSRTPIREALNKLEQENLIKIIPKKGVFVNQISLKNVLDVFEVRLLVEPKAIELFGYKYDLNELLKYRDYHNSLQYNFSKEQFYDFLLNDNNFHNFLIKPYNNDFIYTLMENVKIHGVRIRAYTGSNSYMENVIKEHLDIINALIDNNIEQAGKALKKHLMNSKDRTVNAFALKN